MGQTNSNFKQDVRDSDDRWYRNDEVTARAKWHKERRRQQLELDELKRQKDEFISAKVKQKQKENPAEPPPVTYDPPLEDDPVAGEIPGSVNAYDPTTFDDDTCLSENTSNTGVSGYGPEHMLGVRYTGPGVSNGKFQNSVEFGDRTPLDTLDFYSRMHDSAYAKYKDKWHRRAADQLYYDQAMKLRQAFPWVAANAVWHGNKLLMGDNPLSKPSAHEVEVLRSAKRDLMRYFDEDPHYSYYVKLYPDAYQSREKQRKKESKHTSLPSTVIEVQKKALAEKRNDEVVVRQRRKIKGFSQLYAEAKKSLTLPKRKWKKKKKNVQRAVKVLPHLYA